MRDSQRVERIVAVIPVRGLEGAKSRLGEVLDAEERRDLVTAMLGQVVAAAVASPQVAEVVVVSPDPAALELAAAAGARPILQRGIGLNEALEAARVEILAAGDAGILVLPADLPAIEPAAVATMIAAVDPPPSVVLATDRLGRGTNALLLAPGDVIDFAFGSDSRSAHARAARHARARYVEVDAGLSLDLDTAEDLLLTEISGRGSRRPGTPPAGSDPTARSR